MTDSWRSDRVGAALRGDNPTVLRRLEAGFAVIGDVQFLPGYSVLITDTPGTDRLTDLPRSRRAAFLADMEMLGEAVERVCSRRDPGLRRVNLEIQGNHDAFLHAHVWPRYDWEGPGQVWRPVGAYPVERWREPAPSTVLGAAHDRLRAELGAELDLLRAEAGHEASRDAAPDAVRDAARDAAPDAGRQGGIRPQTGSVAGHSSP